MSYLILIGAMVLFCFGCWLFYEAMTISDIYLDELNSKEDDWL
jgi:hypothetical protein